MTRPHLLSLSSEQLHLVMRRADKLPRRRLKRTRGGTTARRRALFRERVRLHRERRRQDLLDAHVPIDDRLLHLLIDLQWLAPHEAGNQQAIDAALTAMLRMRFRHQSSAPIRRRGSVIRWPLCRNRGRF